MERPQFRIEWRGYLCLLENFLVDCFSPHPRFFLCTRDGYPKNYTYTLVNSGDGSGLFTLKHTHTH